MPEAAKYDVSEQSAVRLFVETYDLAAYSDLLGIVTAIISIVTLFNLFRTKKLIKRGLLTKSVVSDASYAISKMNEIIKAQRAKDWLLALELYGQVATLLGSIKSSGIEFENNHIVVLQDSITHFRQNERLIEKNLSKSIQSDHVQLNSNVSDQLDKLQAILLAIRNEV